MGRWVSRGVRTLAWRGGKYEKVLPGGDPLGLVSPRGQPLGGLHPPPHHKDFVYHIHKNLPFGRAGLVMSMVSFLIAAGELATLDAFSVRQGISTTNDQPSGKEYGRVN